MGTSPGGPANLYEVFGVPQSETSDEIRSDFAENPPEPSTLVASLPEIDEDGVAVALQILTDPKEQHLYDLFGHTGYVDRRLGDRSRKAVAPITERATRTQTFESGTTAGSGGGTDTRIYTPGEGKESSGATIAGSATTRTTTKTKTEQADTVEDTETRVNETFDLQSVIATTVEGGSIAARLTRLGLASSPLADLPGLDYSGWVRSIAVTAYVGIALMAIGGVATLLPFGSAPYAAVSVGTFVFGSGTVYLAAAFGLERRLLWNSVVGTVACTPVLVLLDVDGLAASLPISGIVPALGGYLIGLFGVAIANIYVATTRKCLREAEFESDDALGGRAFTTTDPNRGQPTTRSDSTEVLEKFAATKTLATSDLPTRGTVCSTRRIDAERHITRQLFVEDIREEDEKPPADFRELRNELREDIDQRNQNYPSDFSERTDEYLNPDSVNRRYCPNCNGRSTVECSWCSGSGNRKCRSCSGNGRKRCSQCNGSGRTENGQCSKCNGAGSYVCGNCSGSGRKSCWRCSGNGRLKCKRCSATGTVYEYTTLTREYTTQIEVEHETKSVPKEFVEDAEGNQIRKDRQRNSNPDARTGDLFMHEEEVREIPTTVTTYEYAGDLWELFEIEGTIDYTDYPRNLSVLTKVLAASAVLLMGGYLYIGIVGPPIPP